jgi:hypothetical protein
MKRKGTPDVHHIFYDDTAEDDGHAKMVTIQRNFKPRRQMSFKV